MTQTQPNNVSLPKQDFLYDASNPLGGIIDHLTRQYGGNVHDMGVVEVTASDVYDPIDHPKNAADLGTDTIFHSENELNSWICYDFKKRSVTPTSYSVRTYGYYPGGNHLKSWVFEGSNDQNIWTILDRRDNNHDLNDEFALHNFSISPVPTNSFRFLRLRLTGQDHYESHVLYYLIITSLEVFGTLYQN